MKVRSLVQELTVALLFAFGCGVGERDECFGGWHAVAVRCQAMPTVRGLTLVRGRIVIPG